jgi:hypothetical protein
MNQLTVILISILSFSVFTTTSELSHASPPILVDPLTGRYLGNLNRNTLDPNSIYNELGRYGSPLSPDSVNNELGKYGSPLSPHSPNNELAPLYVPPSSIMYRY